MTFVESVRLCLQRYTEFRGRASRAEYWWFFLFVFAAVIVLQEIDPQWGALFSLAVLLPSMAVATRRLHDTGLSGWWQLLWLVPLLGLVVLLVLLARPGQSGDNPFGPPTELPVTA